MTRVTGPPEDLYNSLCLSIRPSVRHGSDLLVFLEYTGEGPGHGLITDQYLLIRA